jgi:hypothetical protein
MEGKVQESSESQVGQKVLRRALSGTDTVWYADAFKAISPELQPLVLPNAAAHRRHSIQMTHIVLCHGIRPPVNHGKKRWRRDAQ